ncbi:MAG: hypothetical protein ACPH5V_04065, partial [Alcanivorax sp.]
MRSVEQGFSIVLVGAWNHHILNESWVANHLIPENNNATVTLSYPIGGQNLPNRLVFGDVILYASQESIRV